MMRVRPESFVFGAVAFGIAAAMFFLAVMAVRAQGPVDRLEFSSQVTGCDEFHVEVTPVDLYAGAEYRVVLEEDPAPFGTWIEIDTIDIGDSEATILVAEGLLPTDSRYRGTLEILDGEEWVPANIGDSNPTVVYEFTHDEFCPTATPEPTQTATAEPTATATATNTPEPTATPTLIPTLDVPTPVVIVVQPTVEVVGTITPPNTGSGGLK